MSLLLYRPLQNDAAEKLQGIIESELPGEDLEIFYSTGNFSERLRQQSRSNCAVVILADSMNDLQSLFALKNLLTDIRIILVLPERSEEVIAMGYKFRPRFLSYMDSDFSDLAVVLKKIVELMEKDPHQGEVDCAHLH